MSCTAHVAIDAGTLVSYLDFHSEWHSSGTPRRRRKRLNGHELPAGHDIARQIRRWRRGGTVTRKAADRILRWADLSLTDFAAWCEVRDIAVLVRGELYDL